MGKKEGGWGEEEGNPPRQGKQNKEREREINNNNNNNTVWFVLELSKSGDLNGEKPSNKILKSLGHSWIHQGKSEEFPKNP